MSNADVTVIAANSDIGLLYGSFAYLRHLQVNGGAGAGTLALKSKPQLPLRVLNHWDNLDPACRNCYGSAAIEAQRPHAGQVDVGAAGGRPPAPGWPHRSPAARCRRHC